MRAVFGWGVGVVVALIAVAWPTLGLSHKARERGRLSRMGPAPAFTLTAQDGGRLSLEDLHDQNGALRVQYMGIRFALDEFLRDIRFLLREGKPR